MVDIMTDAEQAAFLEWWNKEAWTSQPTPYQAARIGWAGRALLARLSPASPAGAAPAEVEIDIEDNGHGFYRAAFRVGPVGGYGYWHNCRAAAEDDAAEIRGRITAPAIAPAGAADELVREFLADPRVGTICLKCRCIIGGSGCQCPASPAPAATAEAPKIIPLEFTPEQLEHLAEIRRWQDESRNTKIVLGEPYKPAAAAPAAPAADRPVTGIEYNDESHAIDFTDGGGVSMSIRLHPDASGLRAIETLRAAHWLASKEPGTPVPDWVDRAVNGSDTNQQEKQ